MAALAVSVRHGPPYSLYELMMNGPHCAVLLYTARETLGMCMWVSAAGHEAVPGALTSKPWPLRLGPCARHEAKSPLSGKEHTHAPTAPLAQYTVQATNNVCVRGCLCARSAGWSA